MQPFNPHTRGNPSGEILAQVPQVDQVPDSQGEPAENAERLLQEPAWSDQPEWTLDDIQVGYIPGKDNSWLQFIIPLNARGLMAEDHSALAAAYGGRLGTREEREAYHSYLHKKCEDGTATSHQQSLFMGDGREYFLRDAEGIRTYNEPHPFQVHVQNSDPSFSSVSIISPIFPLIVRENALPGAAVTSVQPRQPWQHVPSDAVTVNTKYIKGWLTDFFGGTSRDWSRISRYKNEEGGRVRIFQDSKQGLFIETVHQGDKLNFRVIQAEGASSSADKRGLSSAKIETDLKKNAAADRLVRIFMGAQEGANEEGSDSVDNLIRRAGVALANRHCFAVIDEDHDGTLLACVTMIDYFKSEGCVADESGPIWDLLSSAGCLEEMDSHWRVEVKGVETAVEIGQYLQSLGLHWRRDFQDDIFEELTATLAAKLVSHDE